MIKGLELEQQVNRDAPYILQRHKTRIELDRATRTKNLYDIAKDRASRDDAGAPGMGLSVVMIVKNEARHIGNAISSVLRLADEIVVLDTGSDDDTVKIAKGFPRVAVYTKTFIPWDFAKARNHAISLAKNDMIFTLDGHEELKAAPKQMVFKKEWIYHVNLLDVTDDFTLLCDGLTPRIFHRSMRYVGGIQNDLVAPRKMELCDTPIELLHWGESTDRDTRSRAVLNEEARWDDFSDLYRRCKLAVMLSDWERFGEYWDKAYSMYARMPGIVQLRNVSFLLMKAYCCFGEQKYGEALSAIHKYEKMLGRKTLNTHYLRFCFFYAEGLWTFALDECKRYLCSATVRPGRITRESIRHFLHMQYVKDVLEYQVNKETDNG